MLHGKVVRELETDKVEQDSIDEGIAAGLMKAFYNAEKTEKASQEDKNKLRAEFSKAVARVEASQIEQRVGAGMDDSSAALIVAVWWSWHRHLIVQPEPTQPPELIKYPYNPDFPIYNDNTTGNVTGNVTDNYTGNSTDGQERPSPGPQPAPVEDPYASDPPQGEKIEDNFSGEIRRLLNMLMD